MFDLDQLKLNDSSLDGIEILISSKFDIKKRNKSTQYLQREISWTNWTKCGQTSDSFGRSVISVDCSKVSELSEW